MFRFFVPHLEWLSGPVEGRYLSLSIALRTPLEGEFLIYDGSN